MTKPTALAPPSPPSGDKGATGHSAIATDNERHLLAKLRRGDAEAFASLVQRYQASLVRIALGFVSSQAVAEEVVQDAWMAVINGLDRFEGRSSFRTWLFSILINRAKTRGQRESRGTPFSALGTGRSDETEITADHFRDNGAWASPPRSWGAESPEEILLRDEMANVIDKAIAALPDRYRVMVTLRDIEELPSDEVCRMLEINEQNQRVLLHRARARLRQWIESHLLEGRGP